MISLTEFRNEFIDRMKELHWRQWSALGVAAHVKPETDWLIDIEPLIVSSMVLGPSDSRLINVCAEWIASNKDWINLHRLKSIAKYFQESTANIPFPEHVTYAIENVRLSKKNIDTELFVSEYMNHLSKEKVPHIRESYDRGKISSIRPQRPPLLQIKLRSILGIDASVEVLIYLLFNKSGNSNKIAREMFYDQKGIYRVLERLVKGGFVDKIPEGRGANYILNNKDIWFAILGSQNIAEYINWTKTYSLLGNIIVALSSRQLADDRYLFSSFFRDIAGESGKLARNINTVLPDQYAYPGEEYFAPFAEFLLASVDKLLKVNRNVSI